MSESELLRAAPDEITHAEKYQVSLPAWTGPYDVLLQVIEDQKLSLLDLDISILLEHYLLHIENATSIDIDEAGDFLVVAATLAQIKSKLLLPKEETPEEEEKDPREDLVRYLMEYQKIKQAAELLGERPLLGRDVFLKGAKEVFEGAESEGSGTLFQLVRGFQKTLRELNASQPMEFETESVSVSDRLREVFHELVTRKELEFRDLVGAAPSKIYVIATFLALLELLRLKKLKISHPEEGGLFYLRVVEGVGEDDLLSSEFDEIAASSEEPSITPIEKEQSL